MKKHHHIRHSSEKIQMSIIYKLLQSATKSYYKLRQLIITKYDKILLQITAANLLQITTILLQTTADVTNCDKFITNCDSYYKLRQLLQITTEH